MTSATSILILGMHRSGTSCLAGSLQQQGLYLGKVIERSPYNQKGNRENPEIMELNDKVLAFNGGSWENPRGSITWAGDHAIRRDRIVEKFLQGNHPAWGFKDPRTLFTFEFWLAGLKNIEVKFAGSFRHPAPVVRSLNKRNQMPREKGLGLWEQYNIRLLKLQKEHGFPLVSFDVDFDEYQQGIKRVLQDLNLPPRPITGEPFFSDSLRHETAADLTDLPGSIVQLYNQLDETYRDQFR